MQVTGLSRLRRNGDSFHHLGGVRWRFFFIFTCHKFPRKFYFSSRAYVASHNRHFASSYSLINFKKAVSTLSYLVGRGEFVCVWVSLFQSNYNWKWRNGIWTKSIQRLRKISIHPNIWRWHDRAHTGMRRFIAKAARMKTRHDCMIHNMLWLAFSSFDWLEKVDFQSVSR